MDESLPHLSLGTPNSAFTKLNVAQHSEDQQSEDQHTFLIMSTPTNRVDTFPKVVTEPFFMRLVLCIDLVDRAFVGIYHL